MIKTPTTGLTVSAINPLLMNQLQQGDQQNQVLFFNQKNMDDVKNHLQTLEDQKTDADPQKGEAEDQDDSEDHTDEDSQEIEEGHPEDPKLEDLNLFAPALVGVPTNPSAGQTETKTGTNKPAEKKSSKTVRKFAGNPGVFAKRFYFEIEKPIQNKHKTSCFKLSHFELVNGQLGQGEAGTVCDREFAVIQCLVVSVRQLIVLWEYLK